MAQSTPKGPEMEEMARREWGVNGKALPERIMRHYMCRDRIKGKMATT
jgi:hypothetical protein